MGCFRQPALGDCPSPACKKLVAPRYEALDNSCSAVVGLVNNHRWSLGSASLRSGSPSPKEWGSGLATDPPIGEKSHLQPWSLPHSKARSRNEEVKGLRSTRWRGKQCRGEHRTGQKSLHRPVVHEGECRWGRIRVIELVRGVLCS